MTKECLNKHKSVFQCFYSDLVNDITKRMELGSYDKKCVNKIIILRSLIRKLYQYIPFEDDVTLAFSLNIIKYDSDNVVTFELTIGGDVITYIGAGDITDVYLYFEAELETLGFNIINQNGQFYAWTYDNNYSYSDTLETDYISTNTKDSFSVTSLEDNECQILDLLNCLDTKTLCKIIEYLKDKMENCGC